MGEIHLNDAFDSFKAVDTFLDRIVIIKILRPNFLSNNHADVSKDFLEQARMIGKLNHNAIAIIYDIGEDEGFSYITREYVEGTQLTNASDNLNLNDWRKVIELCQQIGDGLNYAHQMGIFHTRIKPANIFISETNEVKITDFAIPKFSTAIRKLENPDLKGLSYASPEQINNQKIDQRSDIYSLGVVLYELLTKENPFYDDDDKKLFHNIINKKIPLVHTKNNNMPNGINDIIAKAVAKSPGNRYKNIKQFMLELQNFIKENK